MREVGRGGESWGRKVEGWGDGGSEAVRGRQEGGKGGNNSGWRRGELGVGEEGYRMYRRQGGMT